MTVEEKAASQPHDPGDPLCAEHVRGAIYDRALHICRACNDDKFDPDEECPCG